MVNKLLVVGLFLFGAGGIYFIIKNAIKNQDQFTGKKKK